MRFAYFPGCRIPYDLACYGRSTKVVLSTLGVELVEIEFNCCGYPVRHLSSAAFLLSAARSLALAEGRGLDILTPCQCCFGSLKHADHRLRRDPALRDGINRVLGEEGLQWEGRIRIRHLLSVLTEEVSLKAIRERVERPYQSLPVAAHYGCHALRPGRITRFDNPLAPTIFEELVAVTGANSVEWPLRLECCGAPLSGKNDSLSTALMERKLADAREAGAACICTACTYCQIRFDTGQETRSDARVEAPPLPSILYPQLLGLALGLPGEVLGLGEARLDLGGIEEHLS